MIHITLISKYFSVLLASPNSTNYTPLASVRLLEDQFLCVHHMQRVGGKRRSSQPESKQVFSHLNVDVIVSIFIGNI